MDEQTELLREIRNLLLLIAEPEIAKRDEKRRTDLAAIVGRSKAKANAVLAMDGSKLPKDISKESGLDQGDLSRMIKALREKGLIELDGKQPKLLITIPPNFFESMEKRNG